MIHVEQLCHYSTNIMYCNQRLRCLVDVKRKLAEYEVGFILIPVRLYANLHTPFVSVEKYVFQVIKHALFVVYKRTKGATAFV